MDFFLAVLGEHVLAGYAALAEGALGRLVLVVAVVVVLALFLVENQTFGNCLLAKEADHAVRVPLLLAYHYPLPLHKLVAPLAFVLLALGVAPLADGVPFVFLVFPLQIDFANFAEEVVLVVVLA